jgi:hypothetical protein
MATRSRIGIENEDGSVSSVYCHWDGYPSNNGKILVDHYTDREKVKELIALGSISSLKENVAPPALPPDIIGIRMLKEFKVLPKSDHTFDTPQDDVTIAYHRDRGEDLREARIDASLEAFEKKDNEEYGYVLTNDNVWLVTEHGRALKSVLDILNGVDEDDE